MKRILALAALIPSAALAHGGHDTGGLGSGFAHPFSGADHMLAMVALGLLAAQIGGRAIWALPLAFVGAMLAGGWAGHAGMPFPAVEPAILASIIVLGALVAVAVRLPMPVMLAMAALFGAAHGWAHGAEGPAQGAVAYAGGFALATVLLHVGGIAVGRGLPAMALRAFGAAAAVAGTALVLA